MNPMLPPEEVKRQRQMRRQRLTSKAIHHHCLLMSERLCPRPHRGKMNVTGAKLRKLREAAGWSQAGFAAELQRHGWDIDRAVLVRLESGKRSTVDYEIEFILKVLGKSWADLG
jgi:ribosome-binding protein aMBF1 (putative translation factor)